MSFVSLISVVLNFKFSIQLFNDHLGYCQSESNTILIDIIFDVKLLEHFPNHTRIFDSDALVDDLDLNLPTFNGIDAFGLNLNNSLVGVLDGVSDKICKHLLYSVLVLDDFSIVPNLVNKLVDLNLDLESFLLNLVHEQISHLV